MSTDRPVTSGNDPYFNPYEAPKAGNAAIGSEALGKEGDGIWRDGRLLLMTRSAELPDRCVRCNAPADGFRLKRNLSWHHPLVYLLVLISLPIYVIVALIIRKTAKIRVPLCPEHRTKRLRAIAIGWLLALSGIGAIILGGSYSGPGAQPNLAALILVGIVLLLVGLIWGVIGSQPVVPIRIDEHLIRLKKVCPEFLAELPDWPSPTSR